MLSARKLAANRRNTVSSTGPRTGSGKSRSSRNALKHGLAIAIGQDPVQSEAMACLAKAIAGQMPNPEGLALSRLAADAQLELLRVRSYRTDLINTEIVARKRDAASARTGPEESEGGKTFADPVALLACLDRLVRLERYERRAFSRRNRAFRDLESYLARSLVASG
jgi:hypothetical protein